jgi:uncharacterized protein (DUF2249 family)
VGDHKLDVRPLSKPGKHSAVFRAYDAVPVGESLVLINDHDPGLAPSASSLRGRTACGTLPSTSAARR